MASWAEYKWSMKLQEYSSRLHGCISEISTSPPGMHFPRCASMKLNRLRTGVGLFRSTKHKWGMTLSAACECGAVEQAADHVITFCPTYRHPCGNRGMTTMDENLVSWQQTPVVAWVAFLISLYHSWQSVCQLLIEVLFIDNTAIVV